MSLGTYVLGPEARLRSRPEYQRVFSLGRKAAGRNLILWHGRSSSKTARLGLAVSSKVGCAVRRNRFKRLAREAFRLSRPDFQPGTDLVVYIRPGCRWTGLDGARADLLKLAGEEGLLVR